MKIKDSKKALLTDIGPDILFTLGYVLLSVLFAILLLFTNGCENQEIQTLETNQVDVDTQYILNDFLKQEVSSDSPEFKGNIADLIIAAENNPDLISLLEEQSFAYFFPKYNWQWGLKIPYLSSSEEISRRNSFLQRGNPPESLGDRDELEQTLLNLNQPLTKLSTITSRTFLYQTKSDMEEEIENSRAVNTEYISSINEVESTAVAYIPRQNAEPMKILLFTTFSHSTPVWYNYNPN